MKILATAAVLAAIGFAATATPGAAFAADKPAVYTAAFSNVAVEGYDPVAYFTQGRPVRGTETFKTIHQGAEYRFASAANLAAFRGDPARYAPQYGGYCAWAVSQGYTAKGSPQYWRIVDQKLYLNYNADVQRRWNADIPGSIARATRNWPTVLSR